MTELTCPKCQGSMRRYERSGIDVDQCSDCRGIFLDRGELERLVDAENAWAGRNQQAPDNARPPRDYDRDYERRDYPDRDYERRDSQQGDYGHQRGKPYKKKRRSFLEDLFD